MGPARRDAAGVRGGVCAQAGPQKQEPLPLGPRGPCGGASARAARPCVPLQLLLSRFTEQLEDLHVWASVHSRPAGWGLLHTPRLSVAFALLCAYACLAALVTATGHGQVGHFP